MRIHSGFCRRSGISNGSSIVGCAIAVVAGLAGGCSQATYDLSKAVELRARATECLKHGLSYEYSATVRVQAIEALQDCTNEDTLPWIRVALQDEVPAVRFAALMALGVRQDNVCESAVRKLLQSELSSDRLAAIFVLHKLGDSSYTGQLAGVLLDDQDLAARCHAALILGRLGETGAIKILARAMKESDPGLRANVLESLVLLGAEEAQAAVYAMAYSGIGAEEAFALTVLGKVPGQEYRELFAQKLKSAQHIETKLAAARALGKIGFDDGYDVAYRGLNYRTKENARNDPAENRTLRVRQMAVFALGAIGDPRALHALERIMNNGADPRLQVASARAILEILGEEPPCEALPWNK